MIVCGPCGLEFLLVSIYNAKNTQRKLSVGVWYRPPENCAALDVLYSVLETFDLTVLSNLCYWETLI